MLLTPDSMLATTWPWLALILLGAWHGLNPGMGWLFAVGRGLQERSRRAVFTSLLPIAIGHEASIVIVVIAVSLTEQVLPPFLIRLIAALVLVTFGIYKLARPRSHPGGFGMRIGFAGLAGWSFLMSTAHGAGLMVVPILLRSNAVEAQGQVAGHNHMAPAASPLAGMLATGVHTIAYLAVTGLFAWVVYRKLGLALLRKAWFNFDLIWAAALEATGLVTLLI